MLRVLLLVSLFLVISCKHQHGESTSPLYKEVMAIHDAVMPEMATIHQLKKELKAIKTPASNDIILDQIKSLDDSDEAMMSWMAAFKIPEDKTKEIPYLESEKVKIQQVSDKMFAAMKAAASTIDSLKSIKTEQ